MRNHAVLFVDDEVNILKAVKRLLRNEPWEVLCASRPQEALELLDTSGAQVVVSDQRMPEMSGVDLLAVVRERHPDLVRMMLTGYTEMNVAVEAINRGEIFRLITKPWNDEELKATLRQAFDHFDLKEEIKRLNQVTREQNFKLQDMNRNLEQKVRDRTKQLAEKHQELRVAYIQTIRALAEAVDAKDPHTYGHSERVGVYASKMARELGLPRDLIDCVRHHHEWYDGGDLGYPARLRGDRIPLPSRIILVADTVEAMSSDRPYRKGRSLSAVVQELRKYSGSQFDPNCVDACLRLIEREGEAFIRKDQKFDIDAFLEV